MAVIPFSIPANFSARNTQQPGLGNELAWKVHAQFLHGGHVPIVEVLNRQDWPSKNEEFFTGNFGAISAAREAGYDLVFLGYLDPPQSLDRLRVYTKLIEAESGITLWYGETESRTYEPELRRARDYLPWNHFKPSQVDIHALSERLAYCIVSAVTSEQDPLE